MRKYPRRFFFTKKGNVMAVGDLMSTSQHAETALIMAEHATGEARAAASLAASNRDMIEQVWEVVLENERTLIAIKRFYESCFAGMDVKEAWNGSFPSSDSAEDRLSRGNSSGGGCGGGGTVPDGGR